MAKKKKKKKPKRHLTLFARRVLEYLDRNGKQPAWKIGQFFWPLLSTRGYPAHGGPYRSAFTAGNALGKMRANGRLVDQTYPKHSSPRWRITSKGYETLERSRAAGEPCPSGITEQVAQILAHNFGLAADKAEGHAETIILMCYVRYSSTKEVFATAKALDYLTRQFKATKAQREKVAGAIKILVEEEDRKR